MNIFLDTSSLFKLYHKEQGTESLDLLFTENKISAVYLSEIAKIEFASTVWKKVRLNEITELQAKTMLQIVEADFVKYSFIQVSNSITTVAGTLLSKYGKQGLRTLDSIHLATALSLQTQCALFVTADKLLNNLFIQESLPVHL